MTAPRRCKDCSPTARLRPTVPGVPGPRCATHAREWKRRSRALAHARRLESNFELTPEQYAALKAWQGGKCFGCRKATGATKNLAVDHDHNTGLAYGLLCGPCNRDVLGWSYRQIAYFERAIEYLTNPPAKQLGIVAIHENNRKKEQ